MAESGWAILCEGACRCLMGVRLCVRRAWEWISAKFAKRSARTKPMLDVLRLPMTKEILAKMTPEERSLFLLLGYASNQVNALWKLVIIATNHTPEHPVEQRVSGAQTQIFVRLTIGAMREAWVLVERGFLKSKVGKEYLPLLDANGRAGLERLKKRFGASNPLATIRNNFAFHHPTMEQMEAAFRMATKNKDSEETDWSVFFNKALLNTFFFVSDYVMVHAVTQALNETDVNVAHEKLLGELAPIAADLSEFTFGFAAAIFKRYINDKELLMTLVAQFADAPDIDTPRLPFYVETPGLRNS
jgi:hypothetical protein